MAAKKPILDDEGQPVAGHRVKLLGASGIKTDTHVRSGEWVRITVLGVAGERAYDPQKNGTIREITVQASLQNCEVEVIEAPPEIEGQTKLEAVPPPADGESAED